MGRGKWIFHATGIPPCNTIGRWYYMPDMRCQINRLPPAHRVRPHQNLPLRTHGGLLGLGQILEPQHFPRVDQILDLCLRRVIERVIRRRLSRASTSSPTSRFGNIGEDRMQGTDANHSAACCAGTRSIARPTPLIDVRRKSRRSFKSSNRVARCITVRLSHIIISFTSHLWE